MDDFDMLAINQEEDELSFLNQLQQDLADDDFGNDDGLDLSSPPEQLMAAPLPQVAPAPQVNLAPAFAQEQNRPPLKSAQPNSRLDEAQARREQGELAAGIMNVGERFIGAGVQAAGGTYTPNAGGANTVKALSSLPLKDLTEDLSMPGTLNTIESGDISMDNEREFNDPKSAMSIIYRDTAKKFLQLNVPETLSAQDLDKLIPSLKSLISSSGQRTFKGDVMKGRDFNDKYPTDSFGKPIDPNAMYRMQANGSPPTPFTQTQSVVTDNLGRKFTRGQFDGVNLSGTFAQDGEKEIEDFKPLMETMTARAPKDVQTFTAIEKEFNKDVSKDIKSLRTMKTLMDQIELGRTNPQAKVNAGALAKTAFEPTGVATDADVIRYVTVTGGIEKYNSIRKQVLEGTFTDTAAKFILESLKAVEKTRTNVIRGMANSYDARARDSIVSARVKPGVISDYLLRGIDNQNDTLVQDTKLNIKLKTPLKPGMPVKYKGVKYKVDPSGTTATLEK